MVVNVSTLSNGLCVVTDEMPASGSVAMGAWIGVGARFEPAHLNGVSHLLEHMAFKGTKRRSARDIAEEIEAVGGHINAYTSRETTAYFAKLLKDDAALGVDILGDILQNSTMDPEELQRERGVILQEISQAYDTPDDIVFDYFQQAAYADQAIGRPILGSSQIVRDVSREELMRYMQDNYTGPQMVVSAAGAIKHETFVDMVGDAFSGLSSKQCPLAAKADYTGGHVREQRDLEQTHLILGFEGVAYKDPDFYALAVMCSVLGGGMSSRLFQEVRETRGLAYSIYAYASSFVDTGVVSVYAGTSPDDVPEMTNVIGAEIAKFADTVTEQEIDRAKAQLRSSTIMGMESSSARCEQKARQMMVFGRIIDADEIIRRIEAVDKDSVSRVARRVFSSSLTSSMIGPEKNLMTDQELFDRLSAVSDIAVV